MKINSTLKLLYLVSFFPTTVSMSLALSLVFPHLKKLIAINTAVCTSEETFRTLIILAHPVSILTVQFSINWQSFKEVSFSLSHCVCSKDDLPNLSMDILSEVVDPPFV